MLQLHQQVRERKSIPSDAAALKRLLTWILTSPHQSSYVVYDDQNQAIASATFLHNNGRTVYAFGGQERSNVSALATVLLIQQGIRDAEAVGNDIFDFGGRPTKASTGFTPNLARMRSLGFGPSS